MKQRKEEVSGPASCYRLPILLLFCLLLTANSIMAAPVVLFDQGHKQQFLVEKEGPLDLSSFAGLFRERGCQVKTSMSPLSKAGLEGIDVLIISGAFAPISEGEAQAIMDFLGQGGKVAMMTHIPSPYGWIFPKLGVSVSTGVIREQENIIGDSATDFMVKGLAPHFLTSGLEKFSIFGAWALLARNNSVYSVASSSSKAWVDLNQNDVLDEKDAMQSFSLILSGKVGEGVFVVFGDDAIFQNQFLKGENLMLAKNLVSWFCGEGSSGNLVRNPDFVTQPQLVVTK